MQKVLAHNFALLCKERSFLAEAYEAEAIMCSDESSIISGLLVGLNAFDISIDLKTELAELDAPMRPIDYSVYLRERLPSLDDHDNNNVDVANSSLASNNDR